ncbi:hypothetical protein GCM10027610_094200 [Dactylosporangium cerinum]
MSQVVETVDVAVPVRTAYNQWTQFEQFPAFMNSVREIRQLDDTRLHWVVEFGGVRREFDARITEQHPDERVAWTSTEGPKHAGVVTFHRLDDTHSRVTAQLDIDPEGFVENVADKAGIVDRLIKSDLAKFREFIEQRGTETGAWRGDVEQPDAAAGAVPKPGSWISPGSTPPGAALRSPDATQSPAYGSDAIQAAPDLTQSTDVHRMPDPDDSRHAI